MDDERWRIVGTFRYDPTLAGNGGKDEPAKERFIWHSAGLAGRGSSSYIDSAILRDMSGVWTAAATGTFNSRIYLMQNFRGDVVYVAGASGAPVEWVSYSANGVPFAIGVWDLNSDGVSNEDDLDIGVEWVYNEVYDVRADHDGSGNPPQWMTWDGRTLGRGVLSSVGNRIGYAGYQHAPELAGTVWHVRHRWLNSDRGEWLSPDKLDYIDGPNRYQYVRGRVLVGRDPMGLMFATSVCSARSGSHLRAVSSANRCGGQPGVEIPLRPMQPLPDPFRDCQALCAGDPGTPLEFAMCLQHCRRMFDRGNCEGILSDLSVIPPPRDCSNLSGAACTDCCGFNFDRGLLWCSMMEDFARCHCVRAGGDPFGCQILAISLYQDCIDHTVTPDFEDCLQNCDRPVFAGVVVVMAQS